ncbi:MAG: putative ABC transport system ATP-binding protein [Paraglaciecola sp.]|jgi:putative ABC transport system ATP-binding protein|uniref:ABC transporter ATP-binding protein n=1 Tax=uncultured Paraglaciecola sp. TaxID=1765024 RepID=UPI0025CC611C|nr:ABC transporter ATP-binding protein [uncultured Paraglaciecola sp.]
MPYSLSIKDLFFTWSKKSDFALHIPDWKVKTTEKVFLYGRSGEGKSTLLNLISGIQSRYTGNIQVLGQDMSELSQTQKDTFRANNIGIIFQQFNLLPYLSAEQNILLAQRFKNTKNTQQSDQLASICERLELNSHLLKQKSIELSVGQQQRVAVARALYGSPELIIADEPTSALDTQTREKFIHLLLDCAQSSTVIFVSHDMSLASHFDQQLGLAQLQLRRSETDVI